MEQGILAQLLEALEKTPPISKSPILAELVLASREPIEGQWKYPFHIVRYAAIDIIKSGIFVGDCLKGKKIPSSPPKFKTYPIKDPEELVWFFALPLVIDIEEKISQISQGFHKEINRHFSRMAVNIDDLSRLIGILAKPKTITKLDKIKAEFDSLQKELLVHLPENFFRLKDPIDYMINVLQRHVTEVPDQTIAERVTDILKISDIGDARYKTVLQRMTRRKQQRT